MMEVGECKKAVIVNWHIEGEEDFVVLGNYATLSSRNPETDLYFEEDKTVENDGNNFFLFPMDYKGKCIGRVRGSDGGEDEVEFEVK
jgi:hypothetical protein